jgi:replicative DNA helicase
MAVDRLPPQNVEAEQSVLGSLLIDPDAIIKVASFLRPEDFYRESHQIIYRAVLTLHDRRQPADFVTLVDELTRQEQLEAVGGPAYLTSLINMVPTSVHAEHYGRIVERTSVMRRLISAAGEIAALAYEEREEVDEVIDQAERILFEVSQRRVTKSLTPIRDIIRKYYERIEFLVEHRDETLGVPTGFMDLDRLLGGLQPSDLIIIAARPGVGKSSLATSIAMNAALKHNSVVAMFTLEMSAEQLVQRMISGHTGIDSQRLRLGRIEDLEWVKFTHASSTLSESAIFIDDTPSPSPMEVRTKARRLAAEYALDLIIVDYLQLMQSGERRSENRVQEISYISRALKALARELNVPVVALSQLSRAVESRQDKRPVLSDLRESGCLTGDTLVQVDDGRRIPMRDLAEQGLTLRVMALNEETLVLEPASFRRAWCTGVKPVYRLRTALGREIRASANHPFLTIEGWRRLDELRPGRDHIAAVRVAELATVGGPMEQHETLWDRIVAIEPDGEEPVYDLEVPGHHNFVAGDLVVHNSIEQDADIVMFIYRDEMYHEDTERAHIADIIVAKHRNGPTDTVSLRFEPSLTKFDDLALRSVDEDYFPDDGFGLV